MFLGIGVFDRLSSSSYSSENTRFCSIWLWMTNPDLLSLGGRCTLLPEGAGHKLEIRDLPTPRHRLPPPPEGNRWDLIFHLDEYHDWSPQENGPVPYTRRFDWTAGFFDERILPPPPSGLAPAPRRASQGCRDTQLGPERRDRDPDSDGPRRRRESWRDTVSYRAPPAVLCGHLSRGRF
jgi:hypothetical protein